MNQAEQTPSAARRARPSGARTPPALLALEAALAAAVLIGVAYAAWFLRTRGYLPQPFYDNPSDTFMDLYNTAFWANRPGAWDVWKSVYPPLPFVLLRAVSSARCYVGSVAAARGCDPGPLWLLAGAWGIGAGLAGLRYARRAPLTAVPRWIATLFGLPMLYALERGNLIVVAFAALLLAGEPLARRGRLGLLAEALAYNLKPFLTIFLLPGLVRRRWSAFAGQAAVILGIYVAACLIEQGGWPLTLLRNVGQLMHNTRGAAWNNLYYATTYWQLVHAADGGFFAGWGWSAPAMGAARLLAIVAMTLGAAAVLACYALACARPGRARPRRLWALGFLFIVTLFGASGYSTVVVMPLAFAETGAGRRSALVVICAYLLCLPLDGVIRPLFHLQAQSHLAGRRIWADYGLSIGQLARPGLLLAMEYALASLTLDDLGVGPWVARTAARWRAGAFHTPPRAS